MTALTPLQRVAIDRAAEALEDEARAFYESGDAEGERSVAARLDGAHGFADYHRRRHDVKHRRARELQLVATDLREQFDRTED
jgi:uncharacterized protein YecT (DUF1311 family)